MLTDEIEDSALIALLKVGQVVHVDYSAWRLRKGERLGFESLHKICCRLRWASRVPT
jgi:hypothetical protein